MRFLGEGVMIRRVQLAATAIAILALGSGATQATAKSKVHGAKATAVRKVVLMDFTRPEPIPAPDQATPSPADPEISDVARQMAGAFTNGSDTQPNFPSAIDQQPSIYQPTFSAASLPNPFLTRATAMMPSMPVPAFSAGGSCAQPEYQPDYSHGRAAEERRRLIFPLVHQVACEQGLPVGLFDSLIMQESRYNHLAVSPKGALGLAQLMPGTARQLGANPYTIVDNLRGGARYLRQQVDRFGRYDLALAAYNSGPGRVARLGRVPAIAETKNYVSTISASWAGGGQNPRLALATRTPVGRRAQLIFMSYDQRERTY
jgi:soluble lytic murein transglycosylase-like protein